MPRQRGVNWDVDLAIKLYTEDNYSYDKISKQLKVHPYAIQQALRIRGIESRRPKGKFRKFSLKVLNDLLEKEYMIKDICEIMRISVTSVYVGKKAIKQKKEDGTWEEECKKQQG